MTKITDITLNSHLKGMTQPQTAPVQKFGEKFGEALMSSLAEVNQSQLNANQAAEQIATGENQNLHEAMIKLEQADISLRLMVQMRNKAVEAYQEIMRMQV